jgi:CheY-like chemotaxis protein
MSDESLHILVVDDDKDCAQSAADMLNLRRHKARAATSGEAAIRDAIANPPDVVLLDLLMPKMSGWEVAKRLNALPRPPLIIAISGSNAAPDCPLQTGITLRLTKPVDPGLLIGMLKRVAQTLHQMKRHSPGDEPQGRSGNV